jgi:hypothetical protein
MLIDSYRADISSYRNSAIYGVMNGAIVLRLDVSSNDAQFSHVIRLYLQSGGMLAQ